MNVHQDQVERLIESDLSEDNVHIISDNIEKLQDAEHEIGFHIKASFDLVAKIKDIEKSINEKVSYVADQASFECKRGEFLDMATLCDRLNKCTTILSVHLYPKTKRQIQTVLSCSKARIDGIGSVAKFFLKSDGCFP